jgi:hypothetical protein
MTETDFAEMAAAGVKLGGEIGRVTGNTPPAARAAEVVKGHGPASGGH